jgi:microcystin-dependent protein
MALSFPKFVKGLFVQNETDRTKELGLTVDNTASSGTGTTLVSKQTVNRTLDLPDTSGTLVEKDFSQTLTNKTIDGDNNTIQDLALSSLKTVLVDANKFIVRDGSGQAISTNTVPTGTVVGTSDAQTLTNKTIDADSNTITNIENADIKSGAAISLNKLASLTSNKAIQSDGSGVLSASAVTSTELGQLTGILSSAVGISDTQTLTNKTIDADSNTITNIENADIKSGASISLNKLAATTASRALISDGSGVISPATTTATEIGYVNGVTGSIQPQIDSKQTRSVLTTKGDLYVATASDTVTRIGVGSNGDVLTADNTQATGLIWAASANATPTGSMFDYLGTTSPTGYILASGNTIGSAASGATERANTDTATLYTLFWNSYSNTILPIQDSSGVATTRGVSATADFAANKRLPTPDLRGRVAAGRDNMGGTSANRLGTFINGGLGATGGFEGITLSTTEMPSHTHIQNAHDHNFISAFGGGAGTVINRGSVSNTNGNVVTDTVAIQNTTATNQNTGGGAAHNNIQPTWVTNKIIKL